MMFNRSDPKRIFSHIGAALLAGVVVSTAVSLLFLLPISKDPERIRSLKESLGTGLFFLLVYSPQLAGMGVIWFLLKGLPQEEREAKVMDHEHLLRLFAAMYTLAVLCNLAGTWLTGRFPAGSSRQIDAITLTIQSGDLMGILIPVELGPILEELIFRKLLIDRTRRYGEKTAIVFTALCFGLYHGNLTQFLFAFAVGLFLGYIYCRSGNIIYTVVLHMLLNGISAALSLVLPFFASAVDYGVELILIGIFALIGTLLVVGSLYLWRILRKQILVFEDPMPESIPGNEVFQTVYLNPGVSLLFLVSIAGIVLGLFGFDLASFF